MKIIFLTQKGLFFNNIFKINKLTISNNLLVLGPTTRSACFSYATSTSGAETVLSLRRGLDKINKFGYSECTSLVIFGSNLGSNVNKGRFSVSLQKLICLHPEYYSMIVGKLLSDG